MAESMVAPWEFVDELRHPGLDTIAGKVALNQYLSGNPRNGGNDNAHSLFKNLRWYKDGATGQTLNTMVGGSRMDLALKGQGDPGTFVGIWNFMCRNRDKMKKLEIDFHERRARGNSDTKVKKYSGTVYDLYFAGRTDRDAIQKMVQDRFFGIDCIGFVANFLIRSGEWSKYHGMKISQYPQISCKIEVDRAADVKVLDFLIWDGHIALVDYIRSRPGTREVEVDICQSSGGGPQCNERVILRETDAYAPGHRRLFRISGAIPVDGHVYIQRRKDWWY
jgi:hypothetical protein